MSGSKKVKTVEKGKSNESEGKGDESNAIETDSNEENGSHRARAMSVRYDAPLVGQVSFGSSWERRMQTLALFSCSLYFIMPMIPVSWYYTIRMIINPVTRIPVLGYLGYVYLLDQAPTTGKYLFGLFLLGGVVYTSVSVDGCIVHYVLCVYHA